MKLNDDDNVVAAISDYAKVLLEGCQTIPKDGQCVVGETAPLPFVTVFATDELSPRLRGPVGQELLLAKRFPALLRLLQTQDGFRVFVRPDEKLSERNNWPDFRGPRRDAFV